MKRMNHFDNCKKDSMGYVKYWYPKANTWVDFLKDCLVVSLPFLGMFLAYYIV